MSFHWQEGAMRGRGDVFPLAGGCNKRELLPRFSPDVVLE